MRQYQAWRNLTGDVGDPAHYGRADLDRLLTKALKTVRIHKISSNSEKHHFLNDFFVAAGSDCEAAVYAFDAALRAKVEISFAYLKGILKNYPGPDTKDSAPEPQVAEDSLGTAARDDKAGQMDQSDQPSTPSDDPLANYCFFNRRLRHHPYLKQCPEWVRLMWHDLIMDAAWKDHEIEWRGKKLALKRRQWVISFRSLAEEYGQSERMIRYWIRNFEKQLMIQCVTVYSKPNSDEPWNFLTTVAGSVAGNVAGSVAGGVLITLCNYDRFQPNFLSTVAGSVAGSVAGLVALQKNVYKEGVTQEGNPPDPPLKKHTPLTAQKLFEIWNEECAPLQPVESEDLGGVKTLVDHFNAHAKNGRGPEEYWRDFVHKCREVHPDYRMYLDPIFFAKDKAKINKLLRGVYNRSLSDGEKHGGGTKGSQQPGKGSPEHFKGKSFKGAEPTH